MSSLTPDAQGFEAVKARLEEIAEAVGNDDVPLDEALDLFEEAVALGMQISDLLETDVLADPDSAQVDAAETSSADQSAPEAS